LLHSIAIEKAEIYLKDAPGVYLKKKYSSLQIVFENRLVGRFKKVDKNNMSRNAKSNRNDSILAQQPTLFSGISNEMPRITYIDLGYKIDSIWSEFERLVVVCRLNDQILWKIDFTDIEESVIPMNNTSVTETLNIIEETTIKLKQAK